MGRTEVTTLEGKQSFCYDALHTHKDAASGKFHVHVSDENDTTLGTFLGKWRPELLKARIVVNGKRVRDPARFKVRPEMKIKIFMKAARRSK